MPHDKSHDQAHRERDSGSLARRQPKSSSPHRATLPCHVLAQEGLARRPSPSTDDAGAQVARALAVLLDPPLVALVLRKLSGALPVGPPAWLVLAELLSARDEAAIHVTWAQP